MPKNHGRKNVAKNTWKLMMKGSPKLAIRYAKWIIKDGEGKTLTEISLGTKLYDLVEDMGRTFHIDLGYKQAYDDAVDVL